MKWHEKCPKNCKGLVKPYCEFWGKTPKQYVRHLLTEIKDETWWEGRGGFYVSINGLLAGPKGQSADPIRITLDNRLVDILIPDLNRPSVSVKTSDLKRILYEGLDRQDPEIRRMLLGRKDRIDVHRLVCYWYEVGKEWGHELPNLIAKREVHHRDHCRLNNRIFNLFPLTTLAHNFVHGRRKDKIPLPTMIDYLRASNIKQERLFARIEDMLKVFDKED